MRWYSPGYKEAFKRRLEYLEKVMDPDVLAGAKMLSERFEAVKTQSRSGKLPVGNQRDKETDSQPNLKSQNPRPIQP